MGPLRCTKQVKGRGLRVEGLIRSEIMGCVFLHSEQALQGNWIVSKSPEQEKSWIQPKEKEKENVFAVVCQCGGQGDRAVSLRHPKSLDSHETQETPRYAPKLCVL